MSFLRQLLKRPADYKFRLRLFIASGLTWVYVMRNSDPWMMIAHKWKMNDGSLFGYLLGQEPELPGMCSEKPTFLPQLQVLIDEVKAKVKISPDHLDDITLLPVATSIWSPMFGKAGVNGAYTFIPDYFNASSIDDLRANQLSKLIKKCYGVTVEREDWISSPGQMLARSFILSEKAKKFFIAHQLYAVEYSPFITKPPILMLNVYFCMNLVSRIITSTGQTAAQISNSKFLVIASIPAFCFYLAWLVFNKFYIDSIHWIDSDARAITHGALSVSDMDTLKKEMEEARLTGRRPSEKLIEKTDAIDIEMVEGAVEFYSKLVTRHLALKDIADTKAKWYDTTHRKFTYDGRFKGTGWKIRFIPNPYESLNKVRSWVSFVY